MVHGVRGRMAFRGRYSGRRDRALAPITGFSVPKTSQTAEAISVGRVPGAGSTERCITFRCVARSRRRYPPVTPNYCGQFAAVTDRRREASRERRDEPTAGNASYDRSHRRITMSRYVKTDV